VHREIPDTHASAPCTPVLYQGIKMSHGLAFPFSIINFNPAIELIDSVNPSISKGDEDGGESGSLL
jgi:hypothetical protein